MSALPAETTPRRRQHRSLALRERVLESATRDFAAFGFEGASTRAIAARAGVQHPLVLYHFETKEGLWRACVQSAVTRLKEAFARIDADLGPGRQLPLMLEALVRFAAEQPDFHHIIASVGREPGPQLDWLLHENGLEGFVRQMTARIAAAQAEGRFVQGDPLLLYYMFLGAASKPYLHGAEIEAISGREPGDAGSVDRHLAQCLALFVRTP